MKNYLPIQLFFIGWLLALAGGAAAEPVDPCWPGQWHRLQAAEKKEWTHWPRARIRQLEDEREQLIEQIAVLPQHDPKTLPDHLGYHSLFEDPGSDRSLPMHQLSATLVWPRKLDSIALAPAFNPLDPEDGVYAFPKRFKIEVLETVGRWVGGKDGKWVSEKGIDDSWREVVNWMTEDFPDPGPYPVFFSGINQYVKQVRLTVPQMVRESGVAYYALGEMYLFLQEKGQIADNMAVWTSSGIEFSATDSFSMPPLWDMDYLHDGITGLGVPLSGETVDAQDLMVTYGSRGTSSEHVEILLDLGKVERVGRIELWPAGAPYLLALPSIGFPKNISVELSADADFTSSTVIDVKNVGGRIHRDHRLTVLCQGYNAQYIRIHLEDLPEYKGHRILGMGEISVSEFGKVFSVDCKVTAKGIPDAFSEQLQRLVDGCSRQRRILLESEWLKGLAKRRPLDRRLARVEQELAQSRISWDRIKLRSSVWVGSLLCVGLLGAMGLQRLQRRRVMKTLKLRITRDLHDEVGSNLGSITLAAKRMEDAGATAADLSDLSLMAREASASLRDVVWVIDQTTIRLPILAQKLAERAERILGGIELSVDVSQGIPDRIVPLTFKRHLIMFFREAVHNCARHSNATQVRVAISTNDERLELSLQDNGCGFDPTGEREGWGLDSMRKRAHELGGEMDLQSKPGEGTTVVLAVPLSALLKKTDHQYKTSN